jgi:hypothetical protein
MDAMLHALGTPRRREILRLVWRGERSAGNLHRALGDVTFGAVSQHLRVLERAGAGGGGGGGGGEGPPRLYAARVEALGALAPWLETMWDDALYALKIRAELEEARRGPQPREAGRRRAGGRRNRPGVGRRRGRAHARRGSREEGS